MADILKLVASFIMFSGAFGMLVFTDTFQRFHAAGKVGIFGLALFILADSIRYHQDTGNWSFIGYLGITILLITGPFGSHLLARAVYHAKRAPGEDQN